MSIKTADNLLSKIVRARDKVCQVCKNPEHDSNEFSKLTNAHYVPRWYVNTRFDEKNCTTICISDARYLTDHPKEQEKFFIELFGQKACGELWSLANSPKVIYKTYYGSKDHMNELKQRLEELQ